ncbi:hypothetical protein TcasGA2_TC005936 [Tribolium castaneum]|uniref:Uncharacterized protein n=1 Tax=Tribolium castaneum TaxID=7070 RepID=D6WVG8_TRICA|nr:hypothetical protein TcasGA2_TC005936 [Tribolium castaneum]
MIRLFPQAYHELVGHASPHPCTEETVADMTIATEECDSYTEKKIEIGDRIGNDDAHNVVAYRQYNVIPIGDIYQFMDDIKTHKNVEESSYIITERDRVTDPAPVGNCGG